MYSFSFPNMLNSSHTQLLQDKDAVSSNLVLLLGSEQLSLFGDPYFGSRLKRVLFEQSSSLIVDLIVDEIYTTILTFIPQLYLTRKDISITTNGVDVFATIRAIYIPDNTSDLYKINLTNYENEASV